MITVKIPYKHDEVIKLGEKIKDAATEDGMNKVYSDKVAEMAQNLKKKLRKELYLDDKDYMEIMHKVIEYEEELKKAEKSMERSKNKFIEAHQTTMEVLKVSGEVEISSERFHKKGERKFDCVFCTKRFDTSNLWKHHILMYHWPDIDKSVSIIYYFNIFITMYFFFLRINTILFNL